MICHVALQTDRLASTLQWLHQLPVLDADAPAGQQADLAAGAARYMRLLIPSLFFGGACCGAACTMSCTPPVMCLHLSYCCFRPMLLARFYALGETLLPKAEALWVTAGAFQCMNRYLAAQSIVNPQTFATAGSIMFAPLANWLLIHYFG